MYLQERDVVFARNIFDHWCRGREVHFVDIEPFGRQELRHEDGQRIRLCAHGCRREDELDSRVGDHPTQPAGDPVASCARGRIGGHGNRARAERTEERGDEVETGRKQEEHASAGLDAVADHRGEQPASTIELEPRDSIDILLSGFQERVGAIGALFYRTQREQIGQGRYGGRYGAHESS